MVTLVELFAGFVSVPEKVAEPVEVKPLPATVGVAITVTIAVWPPLIVPTLHVIVVPEAVHEPSDVVAELIWKLAGTVSLKTTPGALTVPRLSLICQVKVTFEPTVGLPLFEEPVTWTSVVTFVPLELMVVAELAVLLAEFVSATGFPSASCAETEALFETEPVTELESNTETVTDALEPAFRAPRLQLKLSPPGAPWQTPCDAVNVESGAGIVEVINA